MSSHPEASRRRYTTADFPAWLHDDVAMANRDIEECIDRAGIDYALVNRILDADERLRLYIKASQNPNTLVSTEMFSMIFSQSSSATAPSAASSHRQLENLS